ncbi:MAG: EscU/YscU/HrcU family type III secretion system export apparatus switch protein [Thermoanaerobacteraceae bacterium]|nr:EscU/YscU/HrcU family type III secretion system export apparatus switch protein [Thermoanaerobacteraceae bacterium]
MSSKKSTSTNNKKAVALKYDMSEDTTPRVVASGKGLLAEKILELAHKENIPIYKDPHLVEALIQLDLNLEIPPELYRAVAEILAFIYTVDAASGSSDNFYGWNALK